MASADRESTISADRPRTDPTEDRLGYAPFAKQLAASLLRVPRKDGLVVAVYGEWGTGKSTLLNFVVHYLNQAPDSERPVILTFNPWWFSSRQDLTRLFLSQFHAVLAKHRLAKKNVLDKFSDYSDVVSELPLPMGTGKAAARLLELLRKDVVEVKEAVVAALRKNSRPIVVVIDDIDRLTGVELRQLLGTVKAVADFPNVIYILAMDRGMVIRALERAEGPSGEAYLEKIVQVPFDLPIPDRTALRTLLFERLDAVLAETPQEEFDSHYWSNTYVEGIDTFIRTPRDVIRFTNALVVTYQAVRGDANPVDFVAVEALRFFAPVAYDIVRRNADRFAGVEEVGIVGASRRDETKKFHEDWLASLDVSDVEKAAMKRLLVRLFPRLEGVWGSMNYGSDFLLRWRKQRRVCSPEMFDVYFRLRLPEGEVSRTEMDALLLATADASMFGEMLVGLSKQLRPDGTTRVRAFLDRLEDYTREDIPEANIPSVVRALFAVGDAVNTQQDEGRGFFDYGNEIRVARLLRQVLGRVPQTRRFELLREAIEGSGSVATILDEVRSIGNEHRKDDETAIPPERRLVSAVHVPELEKLAVLKVRSAAQDGSLLKAPDLAANLYIWRALSGDGEVRDWVNNIISTDEGFVQIVSSFLGTGHRRALTEAVSRTYYRLDPKSLEPLLDVDAAADRAQRLLKEMTLSERERIALAQFTKEYRLRKEGKDPRTALDENE